MPTNQAASVVESGTPVLRVLSAPSPIPIAPESIEVEPTSSSRKTALEPSRAADIAADYGVNPRTVLDWLRIIQQAHPWLEEPDLRTGTSNRVRYTILFQQLLIEFKNSGLSEAAWIAAVHAAHPERLAQTHQPHIKATEPIYPPAHPQDYQRYVPTEADRLEYEPTAITYTAPSHNPLTIALHQKLAAMQRANEDGTMRMADFNEAIDQTQQMLTALGDMSVVQDAVATADRHEFLFQKTYAARRELHQATRAGVELEPSVLLETRAAMPGKPQEQPQPGSAG